MRLVTEGTTGYWYALLSNDHIKFNHCSPKDNLVPVVQRVCNTIQWISRYPADKIYSNKYI